MLSFIGVKEINATPMTLGEAKEQGVRVSENDHTNNSAGFLVVYEDGYKSWSPKDVFNKAYRLTKGMSFGLAIEAAKLGKKIARKGWNGKNMFVVYMPPLSLPPYNTGETFRKVNDRTAKFIGEDTPLNCQPYFAMFNAQKEWIPGWLASQSDMLADDYYVVD